MKTLHFTAEQSHCFPFPVGCPVWFFTNVEDGSLSFKKGTVEQVSMDMQNRKTFYRIVHQGKVIDNGHALEKDLAYASQCPVVVSMDGEEGKTVDATVLQAKYMNGKMFYSVMYNIGGGSTSYKDGIVGERIKYRVDKAPVEEVAMESARMDGSTKASKETPVAEIIIGSASIAQSSNSGARNSFGSANHENEHIRKRKTVSSTHLQNASSENASEQKLNAAVQDSERTSATRTENKLSGREEGEVSSQESKNHKQSPISPISSMESPKHSSNSNQGLPKFKRLITNGSDGGLTAKRSKISTGGDDHPSFEITLPLWLQKDKDSRNRLYAHLYGPRDDPHYKPLRKESNCNMLVHKNTNADQPMTITVEHMNKNPYEADKNFTLARRMIEDILLQFQLPGLPKLGEDGSRGRLLYEIMRCFGKNPQRSTSCAVVQTNPFYGDNKHCCMSLVELPSCFEIKGKSFHGQYLRDKAFLKIVRREKGYIYLCGDGFDHSVKYGDPYVLVTANATDFTAVDRIVDYVEDEIRSHQRSCSCFLPNSMSSKC